MYLLNVTEQLLNPQNIHNLQVFKGNAQELTIIFFYFVIFVVNDILLALRIFSNIALPYVMHVPLECDQKLLNPRNINNLRISRVMLKN